MTGQHALAGFYWGAVAALALPLALIALTSLADGPIVGFPLGMPSLRWYGAALADPAWSRAFALSAALAMACAVLAVISGAWIALAGAALRRRWMRVALLAGTLIPLITPGIVHAMALRIGIRTIGLDPGPAAILLGHVIHASPYAAIMVGARLATMPPELIDAAHDLGAGPAGAFIHVVVPWLRPALLGAGGLAALASFDDFIRSFFLGGYEPTLPVLLFGRLRSGLTPEINAVATVVVLLTCGVGAAADLATRRRRTETA